MRRVCRSTVVAVILLLGMAPPATAVEPDAGDLLLDGETWNGATITIEGELVGDYVRGGDGMLWVQLNQDPYVEAPLREGGNAVGGNTAIAVRIPSDLRAALGPLGRYDRRGPVVRVTGVWRWHDSAAAGYSHLQVIDLVVIETSRPMRQDANWFAVGFGVVLLTLASWRGSRLWRRRIGSESITG